MLSWSWLEIELSPSQFVQVQSACGTEIDDSQQEFPVLGAYQHTRIQHVPGLESTAWIGINDQDQEGDFLWFYGTLDDYTNWNVGEPND